jgi:hypothetical protein
MPTDKGTQNMKRAITSVLLMTMILGLASAAGTNHYLLVYDHPTAATRHAIQFLDQYARMNGGYRMEVVPLEQISSAQPSDYRALVVLDTGPGEGIDSRFSSVIDSWGAELPVAAVDLVPGRRSTSVDHSGVDAVTAATMWRGRGFFDGNNQVYQMHERWSDFVVQTLNNAR